MEVSGGFFCSASPQGGCLLGVRGMASSSNQATDSCSLLEGYCGPISCFSLKKGPIGVKRSPMSRRSGLSKCCVLRNGHRNAVTCGALPQLHHA